MAGTGTGSSSPQGERAGGNNQGKRFRNRGAQGRGSEGPCVFSCAGAARGRGEQKAACWPPSLPLSLPLSLARSLPPSLFRGVVPVYLFILRQCGYVYRSTAPLDTPSSSRLDVHPSTAPAAPSRCHSDSLTPIPPFSPSLSRVCLRAALVNCYDGCQDAQGDGAWVPQLL